MHIITEQIMIITGDNSSQINIYLQCISYIDCREEANIIVIKIERDPGRRLRSLLINYHDIFLFHIPVCKFCMH